MKGLGNAPREHDLKRLFSKLPLETQTKIQGVYELKYLANAKKFTEMMHETRGIEGPATRDEVLDASKDAFEHWRYCYEHFGAKEVGWFADGVTESAREPLGLGPSTK